MDTLKSFNSTHLQLTIHFHLHSGEEKDQKRRGGGKVFYFDAVLDQTSTQEEMYERCVAPLVEACLEGYNVTILAYGQTVSQQSCPSIVSSTRHSAVISSRCVSVAHCLLQGSGKTYTMGTAGANLGDGPTSDTGIIPRVVYHLFQRLEQRMAESTEHRVAASEEATTDDGDSFSLRVSFLEIHNDSLVDLLGAENPERSPKQQPVIREVNGDIQVQGLSPSFLHSFNLSFFLSFSIHSFIPPFLFPLLSFLLLASARLLHVDQ